MRWGASNTSFVERDSATPPARLRRPAHAGGREESQDRQDGARHPLRSTRAGAAAAPSLRAAAIPRCGGCSTGRAMCACRSTRACRCRWARFCASSCSRPKQDKGAAVVLDPATGDLLAAVSFPLPPIGPGDAARRGSRCADEAPLIRISIARATACIRRARLSKWSPPWRRCAKIRSWRKQDLRVHPPAGRPRGQLHCAARTGPSATTSRTRRRTAPSTWSAAS